MVDDLSKAIQWSQKASEKYYDWVRQMLSLSFAGLTALVALQGNYRPDNDLARYLLWGTFAFLTSSVVVSAIVLRGEVHAMRHLSRQLAEEAQLHAGIPPAIALTAGKCLPWALSLSVLFLFSFSVANSLPTKKTTIMQQQPQTSPQTSKGSG